MDLGNECRVHESLEDTANDSASEKLSGTSEYKLKKNGSCEVENNDTNELNQRGDEEYGHVELKSEASSSLHSTTRKGYGLKKWRRINRDAIREVGSSIHAAQTVTPEFRYSGADRSKRTQYAEIKDKSSGSVSSTNAVVRNFDGFALPDDSSLGLSPSFAAGVDSENSEDRSSKSSTAASAPKTRHDIPLIGGFPGDKSKVSSLNGNNLNHPMQFGQQGKSTSKKARGKGVKIEKENSHSSVESDSRSSNFVFVQGTYSVNNGVRNEGDGEKGDAVGKQVNGHEGGCDEGFDALSHEGEGLAADSSWVDKHERSESHGPLREKDPLAESILVLQSAQEALEQEVLKFKEIGIDVSADGPVSHLCKDSPETSPRFLQSEVAETGSGDMITEVEDVFKQKVEAEVEYLAISRTVQELKVAAVEQITLLDNCKILASEYTQMLHKLGDAENKAASDGEKFSKSNDGEIANAEELLKLQRRVGKYGSCFAVQLLILLVFFFGLQFSQDYIDPFPT